MRQLLTQEHSMTANLRTMCDVLDSTGNRSLAINGIGHKNIRPLPSLPPPPFPHPPNPLPSPSLHIPTPSTHCPLPHPSPPSLSPLPLPNKKGHNVQITKQQITNIQRHCGGFAVRRSHKAFWFRAALKLSQKKTMGM